jgi:hypothetical protein
MGDRSCDGLRTRLYARLYAIDRHKHIDPQVGVLLVLDEIAETNEPQLRAANPLTSLCSLFAFSTGSRTGGRDLPRRTGERGAS